MGGVRRVLTGAALACGDTEPGRYATAPARGGKAPAGGADRGPSPTAEAPDRPPRRGAEACSRAEQHRRRLIDGALRCLERRGLAATTVDDIARAGGCSRATVYRVFPGGRDEVLAGVMAAESSRLLDAVRRATARADALETVVVAGTLGAGRWLADHRLLGTLLAREPEAVLPWLTFERQDRLLQAAGQWAAPLLMRWLEPQQARRLGEHMARIVLVYGIGGSAKDTVADEAWVRHLVATYVLPGSPSDDATVHRMKGAGADVGDDACAAGVDDEGARL